METQNEQKANEIVDKFYGNFVPFHAHSKAFEECAKAKNAVLDAMEWKEKQLVDKCKEFCDRQTTGEYYNRQGVFQIDKYIDDMLNFMKGE